MHQQNTGGENNLRDSGSEKGQKGDNQGSRKQHITGKLPDLA